MPDVLREVFLARQPLVDASLEVVGYEVLYHDADGRAPDVAGGGLQATARVLVDGVLGADGGIMAAGEDVYVNVPVALLVSGAMLDLPSASLVLELAEEAEDAPDLRDAIVAHRRAGFRIALDNVVPDDPRLSLCDVVDLVKVDVLLSGASSGLRLIRELAARRDVVVIAEKVEDPQYFDRVILAGATLVQGFFFTRPRAVRSVRPIGLGPGHVALLEAISQREVDLAVVERLIRSDVTMTDRFLRLVDTTAGWRKVESVHHGLVMLGQRAVQRWVTLLVMSAIASDAPAELLTVASVRARYCEVLEELRGTGNRLEAFSLGMFSVLGSYGRLSEDVVAALPLRDDVRAALRGEPGPMRDLIELQYAAEAADWDALVSLGRGLGIEPRQLAAAHVEALTWASALKGQLPAR